MGDSGRPVSGRGLLGDLGLVVVLGGVLVGFCVDVETLVVVFGEVFGGRVVLGGFVVDFGGLVVGF